MVSLYTGQSGQGKTTILKNILGEKVKCGRMVVTNLANFDCNDFDQDRLDIVLSHDNFENTFYYEELVVYQNRLVVVDEGQISEDTYTDAFLNMLTLICRKGEILILDEPDLCLTMDETTALIKIIRQVKDTYDEVYIATNNSWLYMLADKAYLVENLTAQEIKPNELYGHII